MVTLIQARLQAAVADRYVINRTLGEGGMGVVFHATDVKHDRPVAIKVLRNEAAESVGADRFLREIRITAKLDHPHILMLIDSGAAEELLYYVMPFVDGESLRDRLVRESPLPVSEALRIAVQVADALAYAHRQGVVHRDVKPENILLSGAHVKLADFGIARADSSGQTTGALTQVGMALGTPAYMSPEQFFGDAQVDHRSDLYALACVVYEMLSGAPPFAGEAVTKRLVTDAPRLKMTGQSVPPMVDLVVARALARDAADRHATIDEFAAALQVEISGPVVLRTGSDGRPASARSVFVGREREMAEGRELLAGLAHGRGGLLFLSGEPGVGKTRLANALLDEARRVRALCLVGHCYEMEGMPPYTPFGQVLEYVSRLVPPATFRETLGDAASEVARVQPMLRQMFADIPEPLDLPPDRQRAHLHAQYRAFNERAAKVAPIVLLLDDLHWADEPSLALLANMATYLDRLPIVIIGTYRDTDLDTERPFATVLESLARQRLGRRVAVRRLPIDGTAALLTALGGSVPPDSLVEVLHAETDGNPFFVEEVFQHLCEEGRLFDATGAWISGIDTATLDVPEGVRLVVGRRLKRLSHPCQQMLQSAAVIAPRFELPTLLALGEQDEDTLLDVLDEAVGAHLILEERGARVPTYRFAHELIRQTLLAPLSLPRRQRRHLKVAQALEESLGAKAAARTADIAYHYFQAGAAADESITVSWLVRAAEQALMSGAYAEAVAQCERALSVSEGLPATDDGQLHDRYGRALRAVGRWDDALRALRHADLRYGEGRAYVARAVIQQQLNTLMGWMAKPDESLSLVEAALEATPSGEFTARAILLTVKLSAISTMAFPYRVAHDVLIAAKQAIAASGDSLAEEALEAIYPGFCQCYSLFDEMTAALDATIPKLLEPRNRQVYCEALGQRIYAQRFRDPRPDDVAEAERVRTLAGESGHHGAWLYGDISGVIRAFLDGDEEGYIRWAEQSQSTWAAVGEWRKLNLGPVADMMVWRGRAAEAERLAMESATPLVGYWVGAIEASAMLAAARQSPERGRARLEQFAHLVSESDEPLPSGSLVFTAYTAEALVHIGEPERAARLLPPMRTAMATGMRLLWVHAPLALRAAISAASAELWDEAEQYLAMADELATCFPRSLLRAEADLWRGWVLNRRGLSGDGMRARSLWERSAASMRARGMEGEAALADRWLSVNG